MRAALPGMPQVMQTDTGDPRAAPLVSPRLLGSGGSVCSVSDHQLAELHSRNKPRVKLLPRWGNGRGPTVASSCTGPPEKPLVGARHRPATSFA